MGWEATVGASPALFLLSVLAATGVAEHMRRGAPLSLFLISYSATLLVLLNFGASLHYVMPHLLVDGVYACQGATDAPALLLTAGACHVRLAARSIDTTSNSVNNFTTIDANQLR